MSKLFPSNAAELTVTRQITPNITTLSLPFYRFGRVKLGARATLVRLQSGGVAVFSPTSISSEVKETIASLGELKYIVAPDFEHHIHVGPWYEAYPNAKVIGPEGLPQKREKMGFEKVPFNVIFAAANKEQAKIDPDFDADFQYEYFPSHVNKEIVFNYKPDRTLIQADLIMNLPATEQFSKSNDSAETGLPTKMMNSIFTTRGNALGHARFIWYAASKADRESFDASVAKVDQWDFDRIIPCHGDVIDSGGKQIFRKVMQMFIKNH